MGHTLGDWQAKVAGLILDDANVDLTPTQILAVGISPAIAQYSDDRPRRAVVEVPGASSAYFALPAGWVEDFSSLVEVEFPARMQPRRLLDPQSWELVRSAADVTARQILLDQIPAPGQYVRLTFTAPWPVPTSDPAVDQLNDLAYEAVSALAASLCCVSLGSEASRSRAGAIPADFTDGRQRAANLIEAARIYRGVYDSFLGRSAGGKTDGSPAYGSFDLDAQWLSVFHGGRR